MYVLVLGLGFITRFERRRWQAAVSRERQLRRERVELSQTIHDTIAQTAYMISLGIHRARGLAGSSNTDLLATLDATATLSKSAMWEMRGPIDAAHILEGRNVGTRPVVALRDVREDHRGPCLDDTARTRALTCHADPVSSLRHRA